MLTGGLGAALLRMPMDVRLPREGTFAMLLTLVRFSPVLCNDGVVSRHEGAILVIVSFS
jgi:hypothetical protein